MSPLLRSSKRPPPADPPAERQLILISAATAACRETLGSASRRLLATVDWTRLCGSLRGRRLLPTLGPRIAELADGRADPDFVAQVEEARQAGLRQGAFLQLISTRLTDALAERGIASAPLKGPFLSESLYGDPGRRLASDIDLLVAPEQLQAAVEVVRGFGYGPPDDHVGARGLPLLHFALAHERGELPPVELHWRVHWYERTFASERLLPAAGAAADSRPAPVDELAALLLFYVRDGFVDLRLATDLGAWWDRFGERLQPGEFARLLDAYPALAHPLTAGLAAAERTVGVPAARVLGTEPQLSLRDRFAVRLANPNPHVRRSQLHADMGLIDGLLMPRDEFRVFLRRQVLLPRDLLEGRAMHREEQSHSPLAHGARVLARYSLALTRLLRRPETLPATAPVAAAGSRPQPQTL